MNSVKIIDKDTLQFADEDLSQLAESSVKDSSNSCQRTSLANDDANMSNISVLDHICSLIKTIETELNHFFDQTFGRRRGGAKSTPIKILLNELKAASCHSRREYFRRPD